MSGLEGMPSKNSAPAGVVSDTDGSEKEVLSYAERIRAKADEFESELMQYRNFENASGETRGVADYYIEKINEKYHKTYTNNEFANTLGNLTVSAEKWIELLRKPESSVGRLHSADRSLRSILKRLEELHRDASEGEGSADSALNIVNDYLAERVEKYAKGLAERIVATARDSAKENGKNFEQEKQALSQMSLRPNNVYYELLRLPEDLYKRMEFLLDLADKVHNRALFGGDPLTDTWQEDRAPQDLDELQSMYELPSERQNRLKPPSERQ
ncbi:MAG: hypothetical protein Q8Q18_03080 [bacterium]|nr:hypothetical protein [bacterium]